MDNVQQKRQQKVQDDHYTYDNPDDDDKETPAAKADVGRNRPTAGRGRNTIPGSIEKEDR
jgi:hypothetical protein